MKYWVVGLLVILAGCAPAPDLPISSTSSTDSAQEAESAFLGSTNLTEEQWREQLTTKEYRTLWNARTEFPYSGDLLDENRSGVYVTAGCGLEVFRSETKYDSGTGWPSFYDVVEENVEYREDYKLGYKRIEVVSKCGEHLGHVFEDGPQPTGLRYCMNAAALDFVADNQTQEV